MEFVAKIHDLKISQGKSYREISEELGVSSKTIAKALHRPEAFVEGYQRRDPAERRALGNYLEKIEELLRGKEWTRQAGRRVRRTARWVYRQLRKAGYQGAESTVRTYIRQKFKQPRASCPIEHPPGAEAQFDFGKYFVRIGGQVVLVHFVGAVFPFSTRRFLFAFRAERQECLFDAIERTYREAGGVTDRGTLDNTGLAVAKVLQGRRREETEDYLRFRTMLGVEPRYTNRAAGWEKGHVEGTVGWGKRQVLQDLEVDRWEELDRLLLEACEQDARDRRHGEQGKSVQELFEEERSFLMPIPYEGRRSYKTVRARVSPGGMVYVDGSRYSVPIRLRGRNVRIRLFSDELVVTFQHDEVTRYPRDWSGRGEHYRVEHYLELLRRAPALLDHGKPFVRMPAWLHDTRQAFGDDKSLIELLLAVEDGRYTFEELEDACRRARQDGCVTRAAVEQRMLVSRTDRADALERLAPEECSGLDGHRFAIESPEMYDQILEPARRKVM